jgi:coenzyme F420 biosynthesis associated uncharacterized protein
MIDWGLARRIGETVAGEGPDAVLPGDLAALCVTCEEQVVAYTGLRPAIALPAPEAVGRHAWLDANLDSMRETLDPVLERAGNSMGPLGPLIRTGGGMLIAAEVGGLAGYLGQRVLGQYELRLLDPEAPARLLFVAPNIVEAARALDAPLDELLAWIALHEVTHGVQFTGVPWLRPHLAGLLGELLEGLDVKVDAAALLRLPTGEDVRGLVEAVRERGVMAAVLGPERQAVLDRLQATMGVIEGHAEHVMDAVGVSVVPSLELLRGALDRRRRDKPPLLKLLERLIGLEMKLRQYEVGKRFCDSVVDEAGVEALHRAFASPEMLPTMAELEGDWRGWLRRTTPPELRRAS